MINTKGLHHTDNVVAETGKYICEAGQAQELMHGDTFPACPVTGKNTTWRHSAHKHNTGEIVTETGSYSSDTAEHIMLQAGEVFPNCLRSGTPTQWTHAEHV